MFVRAAIVSTLVLAGAALLAAPSANAQANPCDSQQQRIACSQQCCGGRSCPPSCEAECVRACVIACKNPGAAPSASQMSAYQKRCGNRSIR